jgi:PAS domain S-box-containing protein
VIRSGGTQPGELFRLIYEAAPCATVIVNEDGTIIAANVETERLFGYSRDELLGRNVELLVPTPARKQHRGFLDRIQSHLQKRPLGTGQHFRAQRKDGSSFPVEIGLNSIHIPGGICVVSSIIDISDRKRSLAQLRESESRFRKMADTSPVLIWMSGPDKLCTFFNQRWLQFTGRTMEQALGNNWAKDIHQDDLKRCIQIYESSFDARRNFQMEYRLRRYDGEYRWVLDTGVPRFERGGNFAGYIGSCTDITEFKQAQEALASSQKLESVGLLASGVAHDFNNMQSSIIALCESMLENPDLLPDVAKDIQNIRNIALHGTELVRELMTYAGSDLAELGPVNVSLLLEDMLGLLKLSISKRVTLSIHLDRELPDVLMSAAHMRQIAMNLVVNASEAIGQNAGTVEITTSRMHVETGAVSNRVTAGDYVRLTVSDTGSGITEESQGRIFDPFFSTKGAGRGLGLAVVQGIVARYGGTVEVKSVPVKGTEFDILLPCAGGTEPCDAIARSATPR